MPCASVLSSDGVQAALRVLSEMPPIERGRRLEVLPVDRPVWGSLWGSLTPKRADFGGLERTTGINKKEPKALDWQDFWLSFVMGATGPNQ